MAPDIQILTRISDADKQDEIQRRLQTQESEKARQLLALATSQLEALFIVKEMITKKVNGTDRDK